MDTTYDSTFYDKDFVEDTLREEPLRDYSRSILSKSVVFPNWYVTGFTDAEGSFSINVKTTATDKMVFNTK